MTDCISDDSPYALIFVTDFSALFFGSATAAKGEF